ncbi:MAG: glycosyltransferase family 4 protein [Balneolaceae bacterium]
MKPKKKVLIITYYWPPSGGSGVQRWVKFTKYIRQFGWEPVIYTPSNPEAPAIDNSLLKDIPSDVEVIKAPIWEPYTFYKKFVGIKKDEKLGAALMSSGNENSFLKNISIWIRGNFFIPDARKFWISPSVKFLETYLKKEKVDAIISTGPPHSMHLIGLGISKKMNLPWIADFRDPWTNIDFFEDLKLSKFARKKHHKLEKKVLDSTDKIVVISNTMKKEFEEITNSDITVITNGFDSQDFSPKKYLPNIKCTISHIGMLTATRNPQILWEVLKELSVELEGFKENFLLQLVGRVDGSIQADIDKFKLEDLVEIIRYLPHDKVIPIQQKSEALLLIINDSPNAALLLTGKVFEYLAAKRPIICITPIDGDASKLLEETATASTVLYSDKNELKNQIIHIYKSWEKGINIYKESNADQYSRESLTEAFIEQLNSISK